MPCTLFVLTGFLELNLSHAEKLLRGKLWAGKRSVNFCNFDSQLISQHPLTGGEIFISNCSEKQEMCPQAKKDYLYCCPLIQAAGVLHRFETVSNILSIMCRHKRWHSCKHYAISLHPKPNTKKWPLVIAMQIFSCFKIMCFCIGFSCHVCHLINYNKTIHSLMYMRNILEELRAKLATGK